MCNFCLDFDWDAGLVGLDFYFMILLLLLLSLRKYSVAQVVRCKILTGQLKGEVAYCISFIFGLLVFWYLKLMQSRWLLLNFLLVASKEILHWGL